MGILVILNVKMGKDEGFKSIFFGADVIENLQETKFFSSFGVPNVIPLDLPEPNKI